MVKRQLFLEEAQDRALRVRAKDLGISETELLHRALEAVLSAASWAQPAAPQNTPQTALTELLNSARRLSEQHRFPEDYRFDRNALDEEREDGWPKRHCCPVTCSTPNILLYAYDRRNADKQARALEVVRRLGDGLSAALSAQNLAEFANVALKRLSPPFSASEVSAQLELLEQTFIVYPLTAAVVREAVRGTEAYSLSYYDAQIWSVAKRYDVATVLSEDFNVGATLGGVSFLNPLEPAFDISGLPRS